MCPPLVPPNPVWIQSWISKKFKFYHRRYYRILHFCWLMGLMKLGNNEYNRTWWVTVLGSKCGQIQVVHVEEIGLMIKQGILELKTMVLFSSLVHPFFGKPWMRRVSELGMGLGLWMIREGGKTHFFIWLLIKAIKIIIINVLPFFFDIAYVMLTTFYMSFAMSTKITLSAISFMFGWQDFMQHLDIWRTWLLLSKCENVIDTWWKF